MRWALLRRAFSPAVALALAGCAASTVPTPPDPVSSVIPSLTGTPNSVAIFGGYEFVSVQGAGLIVAYAPGAQTPAAINSAPCLDPSGMAAATINGANILAAVCFDTGAVVTFLINSDGTLHKIGSLAGLPQPYPGIALDRTTLYVPLFGGGTANGMVLAISLANPALPSLTGAVTLASPVPGAIVNAVSLAASGGYIYVAAGSENLPLDSSSSIQVIGESTMTLAGSPFIVPHSPQQIAISGATAFVTLYDALQLEAIDISTPSALRSVSLTSLANCHPVPVTVADNIAYAGCYDEDAVARFNVANPAQPQPMAAISGIAFPQDMAIAGTSLLVTGASSGGALYTVDLGEL